MPSPSLTHAPVSEPDATHLSPEPSPFLLLLASALAYLFLFNLISASRMIPFPPSWGHSKAMGLVGFALSLGPLTFLQVSMVRYLTAWKPTAGQRALALIGCIAVWGFLLFLYGKAYPNAPIEMPLGPWVNLALIGTTVLLGTLVALVIRDAAMMLPVLVVGGLVDYWGVYYGTTHQFVKNAPQIVEKVSASVPTLTFGGLPVVTTIGPGDFLFLGIFFACLYRFQLDVRRTFWAFVGLLLLALIGVAVFPLPIPALVPMGAAILLVNWRRFRLSRAEAFAMGYGLAALMGVLWALMAWGPFKK